MFRPRFIALLLALITLVVYLPVFHHGFMMFDDNSYIAENRVVQQGLTWSGVQWAFTSWHADNWHPLTWLSHMLDYELFGLNAGAQHYVNVLFHAANAVLLLLLLLRLTGALWPSAFVAALFAWHPLHVESVAWISERKDVLSTFFEILALLAYARFVSESRARSSKSKIFYGLALFMFALGLMAKPMLVTLPFVLLLLDYWPLQRFPNSRFEVKVVSRLVLEKWPFFLLSAASCVVTFLAQNAGQAVISLQKYPLYPRLNNVPLSYVEYLWKTIWPAKLAVFYPLQTQPPWAAVSMAVLFLAFVTWLACRIHVRHPCLLFGWFWFLGTLVPVIGLIQVCNQAFADRYTYVPSIGLFIAVAFFCWNEATRLRLHPAVFTVAGGLILTGCLLATERQLSYWKDNETLFNHAIAVTKDNGLAHACLGFVFEEKGDTNGAMIQYREALNLEPTIVPAHFNLANLLLWSGKTNESLLEYKTALQLNPHVPLIHESLGALLMALGQFDEAMNQYKQAAQLAPHDPLPHFTMGKVFLKQGKDEEAIDEFREALKINPNDPLILTFSAWVLASDENPQIRNGEEAVTLAERANELTGGQEPFILDALAMSYAEAGRFQDAQQAEERAIQLAQTLGSEETNIMNQRLELYITGQPYRETFTNLPSSTPLGN